jgi:hypothetical protein
MIEDHLAPTAKMKGMSTNRPDASTRDALRQVLQFRFFPMVVGGRLA